MTQQSSSGAFALRSVRRDSDPRSSVRRRWAACALALVPVVFGAVASCGSTQHNSSSSADLLPSVVTMEVRGPVTFVGRAGAVPEPVTWSLRLFNTVGSSSPWKIAADARWLRLSVSEGVLGPRSSTLVEVTLDPRAVGALEAGEHHARVAFVGTRDATPTANVAEFTLDLRGADASTPARTSDRDAQRPAAPAAVSDGFGVPNVEPGDEGWTELVPSADSRLVYVSSSQGNDANDGLSPQSPKATIAAGKALLRHGSPDWLCLRRGDTWTGSIGQWLVSGRSATEPTVLTTYGPSTSRPRIATGTQDGLVTLQTSNSPAKLEHVRIVGLHFTCNEYTGDQGTPHGITWHVPFEDLLVEDCLFEGFHTNVVIEPLNQSGKNFRLRRSVVVDAYTRQASHSQGLYVSNTSGVLLAQNVFDHNGWREDVEGAAPTIFRHNVYLQTDVSAVRAVGNVFANGGSHGLQARQGGAVENNLFVGNAIALLLGSNQSTSGPIRFAARRNVILAGRDITPALPRGFGIDVPAAASGIIENNIIANQAQVGFPIAISLYDGVSAAGMQDVVVEDNVVHEWHGPVILQGAGPKVQGVVFRRNTMVEVTGDDVLLHNNPAPSPGAVTSSDNRFWSRHAPANGWCRLGEGNVSLDAWKSAVGDTTSQAVQPEFFDPRRGVDGYDAFVGGPGTTASFLSNARRLSKETWDDRYTAGAVNAWVRAGFRTP